jgi:hypothetical protein
MQYYQLPLIFCSAKVNPFSIVVAKNYGRNMLPSSFNYVVLAAGQDPGGRRIIINYIYRETVAIVVTFPSDPTFLTLGI